MLGIITTIILVSAIVLIVSLVIGAISFLAPIAEVVLAAFIIWLVWKMLFKNKNEGDRK